MSSSPATPRKARRCVVHFGLAKTGTSAIQEFFFAHRRELLANERLLYPGDETQHWHLASIFSAAPQSLIQIQRLAPDQSVPDFIERTRHALVDEIVAAAPDTIFMSSEYLVAMAPDELGEMNRFVRTLADEVVSICYVRDPWSYSTSYLQELIRNGYAKGSIEPGYAEGNIELIDRIAAHFPGEIIVRPYLSGIGFDSTADLCAFLGIDHRRYAPGEAEGRANAGMSRPAACLLAALNDVWPQFETDGRFRFDGARDWTVEAIISAARSHGPLELSRQRAEQILRLSRLDLERIQTEYLNGDDVFFRHFDNLRFFNIDDTVGIKQLKSQEVGRILIDALRQVANRAHENMVWAHHAEAEAAYYCGLYLLHQGDPVQAKLQFERVLKFRPGDPQARALIAQLSGDRVASVVAPGAAVPAAPGSTEDGPVA